MTSLRNRIMHNTWWPATRIILDWFLPPRCPITGALVSKSGTIDPAFWARLSFIQRPFCDHCGDPFPIEMAEEFMCGSCLADKPPFAKARAVIRYDNVSAKMIMKFKHADGTVLTPLFANWLKTIGADMIAQSDIIVPVPLYRFRLLKRRYNQAALLGAFLAKKTGLIHTPLVLERIQATESQGHKTRLERFENVQYAFAVPDKYKKFVAGKHVLLVDDVYTSGATSISCTRELLKAGALSVNVLCVTRVARSI